LNLQIAPTLPRALASILRKFNGKPVITAPEHSFYTASDKAYFMIDLDAHRYNYPTRTV